MKKKVRVKMCCTATVYINEDILGNCEIEDVEDIGDIDDFEIIEDDII